MKKNMSGIPALERRIGISFRNKRHLTQALTHSSYRNEMLAAGTPAKTAGGDNERLEFFGDAILSFVICKKLYTEFPRCDEGILSKYRSLLVSRKLLFTIAKKIKLHHYLFLGQGEQNIKFLDKTNMMADALEALIAALYIDRGMRTAEKFISTYFDPYLTRTTLGRLDATHNYKNKLQEFAQKRFQTLPVYKTIPHQDRFESTVMIKRKPYGSGLGKSKREAEKNAAKTTLIKLRKEKKN